MSIQLSEDALCAFQEMITDNLERILRGMEKFPESKKQLKGWREAKRACLKAANLNHKLQEDENLLNEIGELIWETSDQLLEVRAYLSDAVDLSGTPERFAETLAYLKRARV